MVFAPGAFTWDIIVLNVSNLTMIFGVMTEYKARQLYYKPTPEDRVWRQRRLGWYGVQLLLFLTIVYRIGPNLFLFDSPFSPDPQSFVLLTKEYVPIVAAIKAYNRDFGKLPLGSMYLPPEYMPPRFNHNHGEIIDTTSITFLVEKNVVLEYEFSPSMEGWIVHSPRYDGPIAAPIVSAAPKPATQPSLNPVTNISNGN